MKTSPIPPPLRLGICLFCLFSPVGVNIPLVMKATNFNAYKKIEMNNNFISLICWHS